MRTLLVSALLIAASVAPVARAADDDPPPAVTPGRRLPFLGDVARRHGYELPLPFGAGVVYYFVARDITVSEVRLGREGAPLSPVGDFAQFATTSSVNNLNVKLDVWVLPFLNLYAIAGYVSNQSDTTLDLTLPPLVPGGPTRQRRVTLPTSLTGSVGGVGATLAGGYGQLFLALDANAAKADLGFDDRFHAVVTSLRLGWNGKLGARPFRAWANTTYWDTFATASGTLQDPDDGGTLRFEVDQGPAYPWTYGAGLQYSPRRWLDANVDFGTDLHGGWYVAIVPVVRF